MDKHGVSGWYIVPELEHYRCYKLFLIEKRSEIIADVVELPPQSVITTRVLSVDAATLTLQYILELLQKPTPNRMFAKMNETHNTVLRSLEYSFTIIPKSSEQQ